MKNTNEKNKKLVVKKTVLKQLVVKSNLKAGMSWGPGVIQN